MTARRRGHVLSMDWHMSQVSDAHLRENELAERLRWFVLVRWGAVAVALVGYVTAATSLLPARIDPAALVAVTLWLTLTNGIYTVLIRRQDASFRARSLVVAQVVTDYLALSMTTYALGTVETPIHILFLPHIVFVSLFLRRRWSLMLTVLGALFGVAPLVLERWGLLAPVCIFDTPLKEMILRQGPIAWGYVIAIVTAFLASWFLVSEVIASLRLRERRLEEAHEELVRVDEQKTQETLRATHELKAPFAAIKSYVYTLQGGYCGELPEKAERVVERIGTRCDMLMRRISDIIHLSRLKTATHADLDIEPINITRRLRREVAEAHDVAAPRGITVENHAEHADEFWIRAGRPELHTLLSNLLRNAVTYSRDGGRVETRLHADEDTVQVDVVDHGIGIAPEHLSRIFDEHFRSAEAARHYPNGNGLGLVMCKEIARLLSAEIHVQSQLGEGTTFAVTFKRIAPREEGPHGSNPDHRR